MLIRADKGKTIVIVDIDDYNKKKPSTSSATTIS